MRQAALNLSRPHSCHRGGTDDCPFGIRTCPGPNEYVSFFQLYNLDDFSRLFMSFYDFHLLGKKKCGQQPRGLRWLPPSCVCMCVVHRVIIEFTAPPIFTQSKLFHFSCADNALHEFSGKKERNHTWSIRTLAEGCFFFSFFFLFFFFACTLVPSGRNVPGVQRIEAETF